ncbi:MAG TPA: hypothetical protein VHM70_07325 [Polyangiaceae bacterium]|jgi:hypothetical protein|nr:hypothetical protein [Polyangiaceae bacterium]
MALGVTLGCYSELQDDDLYAANSNLVLNTLNPRTPNHPPGIGAAAPQVNPPAPKPPGSTPGPTSSTPSGNTGQPAGSTPPSGSGFTPSPGCEDVVGTIFADPTNGCGGASCHGGGGEHPALIDLGNPDGIKERLLDQNGVICTSSKYIDSANPTKSLLLDKLNEKPSCPAHMPPGKDLGATQLACVKEWVNAIATGKL